MKSKTLAKSPKYLWLISHLPNLGVAQDSITVPFSCLKISVDLSLMALNTFSMLIPA